MTQYVIEDHVTIPPEMFEYLGINPATCTGASFIIPDHQSKDHQAIEGKD